MEAWRRILDREVEDWQLGETDAAVTGRGGVGGAFDSGTHGEAEVLASRMGTRAAQRQRGRAMEAE